MNKIEIALNSRGYSNYDGTVIGATRIASDGPTVSGLQLVPNLNTITVKWDAVDIVNLDYYEVQVANNPAFISPLISRQRSSQFTYHDGDPGSTYFVRIRCKPIEGQNGPWSPALNTTTGLTTVQHLGRGAATNPTDNSIDLTGEAVLDPTGAGAPWTATGTYGNTKIKAKGGTVLPFITFKYAVATNAVWTGGTNDMMIEVLQHDTRNSSTIVNDVSYFDFYGTWGLYLPGAPPTIVYANSAALGLGVPTEPGEGEFTYSVRVTAQTNGMERVMIQPLEINIEVVEARN